MVEDNLGVNFIATAIYGYSSDFFLSILRKFLENNFIFVIYMFLYASGIPTWKLLPTTAPVLTGFHQNRRENEEKEIKQTKLFFIKQSYEKDCEQREDGKHEKHRGQENIIPSNSELFWKTEQWEKNRAVDQRNRTPPQYQQVRCNLYKKADKERVKKMSNNNQTLWWLKKLFNRKNRRFTHEDSIRERIFLFFWM